MFLRNVGIYLQVYTRRHNPEDEHQQRHRRDVIRRHKLAQPIICYQMAQRYCVKSHPLLCSFVLTLFQICHCLIPNYESETHKGELKEM
jgi:hypothetical protein